MIIFEKKDRDYIGYNPKLPKHVFKKVQRKGHFYSVDNERVELFTISVLAEALDRNVACVSEWERAGKFPRPLFTVPNKGTRRRWYSAAQILNMHRIWRYRYSGYKYHKSKETFELFLTDLKKVFYSRVVVVDEKGEPTQ